MPIARSYDVVLTESAEADLANLGADARRCLRQLDRLRDEDMYDWDPLPLPRGDEGSWIALPVCRRIAMAQFTKSSRRRLIIWPRRGLLKVVRILPAEVLAAVVREALGDAEEDDDH